MSRRREKRNPSAALDANPRQRRALFIHAFLAGFTALQILYLALDDLKLNLALSLGFATGYVFSYNIAPRWRALTTYAVSGLAAVASLHYAQLWFQDPALYGNLLGIFGGLLMVLLAFQAFTTHVHRFILMFCVVFLLFGAVASYDLKFMLLLPLFLVFSGCALYTANQIDVHARAAGEGEALPRSSGLTRQFIGILLRAVGVVLGLSILAYIAAPHSAAAPRGLVLNRASAVEEEGPETVPSQPAVNREGSQVVGLGDDFDLTQGGELSSVPTPVLKVKSHHMAYLRAQVYDIFSGTGWGKSPQLESSRQNEDELIHLPDLFDKFAASPEGVVGFNVPLVDFPSSTAFKKLEQDLGVSLAPDNSFSQDYQEDLSYDLNQQQVTLLAPQPPFYFSAYQPYRLQNISRRQTGRAVDVPFVDRASTIRPPDLERDHPIGFSYSVDSLEPHVGPKQLDEVYATGPAAIVEHYTWLPLEGKPWRAEAQQRGLDPAQVRPISQRLINFAKTKFGGPDIVAGKQVYPSVWDKADKIKQWLADSGEFQYSRIYPPLPDNTEVTEGFCLVTHAGYCRHFASAMAVLCRLNGLAARIVSGYAPGTYSLADNAYIYRASNAHAWVEVYFDGYGWIMFDPTPTSRDAFSQPQAAKVVSGVVDFLQELFVIDPARTQKMILDELIGLWTLIRQHALLAAGFLVALIAVGLAGLLAQRRKSAARSREQVKPRNAVIDAYLQVVRGLQQLGFVLETGDTARHVFAAAGEHFPPLEAPLDQLLPVYERAAYSPSEPQADDLAQAAAASREVNAFIQQALEERRKARRRR